MSCWWPLRTTRCTTSQFLGLPFLEPKAAIDKYCLLSTGIARLSFTRWVKYDFWLPPSNKIPTLRVREGSPGRKTSATAVCRRTVWLELAYSDVVVWPLRTAVEKAGAWGFSWSVEGFVTFKVAPSLVEGDCWPLGTRSVSRLQMLEWCRPLQLWQRPWERQSRTRCPFLKHEKHRPLRRRMYFDLGHYTAGAGRMELIAVTAWSIQTSCSDTGTVCWWGRSATVYAPSLPLATVSQWCRPTFPVIYIVYMIYIYDI